MNLAERYPSQFSYVESRLVGNELGHLTEEISKQDVEGVNWFVLIYSKMQEREISKKEPSFWKHWEGTF